MNREKTVIDSRSYLSAINILLELMKLRQREVKSLVYMA